MAMELELGMLIYALNPYAATMNLIPGFNPAKAADVKGILEATAPDQMLGVLKQEGVTQGIFDLVKNAAVANMNRILVELETKQVEYLSWQFKDIPRLVKRAARIEYRHLYQETGVWVTDHLLIGYEGSNGG